ncbi:MAG TPA: hypothetical protein VEF72_11510 [Mycobacterium sp.]|nr:hypothetical protein [Mycobacterium sp.]
MWDREFSGAGRGIPGEQGGVKGIGAGHDALCSVFMGVPVRGAGGQAERRRQPSPGSGLPCQASTAEIDTLLADAATARAALAARMRATATGVSAGGAAYAGQDADAASALGQQVV